MSPIGCSVGPRSRQMTRTDLGALGAAIDSLHSTAYVATAARKAQMDAHCQTWNVDWNQMDGRTFAKMMEMTGAVFTKHRLFEFRIPLNRRCLNGNLADMDQPTAIKARKNTRSQTPITSSEFLFRINNIPRMCGLAPEPECPLESSKRGLHARRD